MTATVPAPLIEFFQQEAAEYLDRLEHLLSHADHAAPDASAFVTHARALRGSAMMTRLEGLAELAATVERVANGVRSNELRWDQRLLFAVRAALAELRALVALAPRWGDNEQRRSRTQAVALAAVAAGYLAGASLPAMSPASPVVPISRLLASDGGATIVYRNPSPPVTIAQRFRGNIAAAADGVAREAAALAAAAPGGTQLAIGDGVRRALVGLADAADSYGAASISSLANIMSRANLDSPNARASIQAFAQLLMNRELSDQELAAEVRNRAALWNSQQGTAVATSVTATPASTTPAEQIVPIEQLLLRGSAALAEARRVNERLRELLLQPNISLTDAKSMAEELRELLDLAAKS